VTPPRAGAALAVVVVHFGYLHIFDDFQIAHIPDFGREAVITCFVLSGFALYQM
jgi:peptidoglycan/LPS O-acetylase OafA/YrhL